jgi:hypothetical protein
VPTEMIGAAFAYLPTPHSATATTAHTAKCLVFISFTPVQRQCDGGRRPARPVIDASCSTPQAAWRSSKTRALTANSLISILDAAPTSASTAADVKDCDTRPRAID